MPAEYRTLVFSQDEIRSALVDHSTRSKRPFPFGEIVHVELGADASDPIELVVRSDLYHEVNKIRLEPEFVAAALIRYCFLQRVPLPRHAIKSLAIEQGLLCLKMRRR